MPTTDHRPDTADTLPAPAERAGAASLLVGGPAEHGSLAPHPATPALLLGDGAGGRGSLAGAVSRRRPAGRGTRRPPRLEEALAAHVAALGNHELGDARLRALVARLGLGGRPPLTLAEAGRLAGISGERVRQLEVRVRRRQAGGGLPNLPQLDAALAAVARNVPMPASGVARLLLESGISACAFSAESLRCAAELLGCELPFVFSGTGRSAVLQPRVVAVAVAHASTIEARARRQVERCGASTIEELERELADDHGLSVARRHLRLLLEGRPTVVLLPRGWFCFSDGRPTGPFVRASLRMLAVSPRLSVEALRDGLRRHNAFRRLPAPPPEAVLAEVYRCHPSFRVDDDDAVSAAGPVDPTIVGPLNRRMVEILRDAPGGVLPRAELLDACHEAGLNLTSVNLYTTYSECLERVAPGLFAARGTACPNAVAAARRRPPARPEDRPLHGWTVQGQPWLTARITPSTWANGVVHVPAQLRAALAGRHFAGHDDHGERVTTLGIDDHGNSWGWTAYLRRSGVTLGDVVRAVFDPATGTARLAVVDRPDAAPPA